MYTIHCMIRTISTEAQSDTDQRDLREKSFWSNKQTAPKAYSRELAS